MSRETAGRGVKPRRRPRRATGGRGARSQAQNRRRRRQQSHQRPPANCARGAALRGLVAVERGRSARLREVVDMSGLSDRDRDLAWELAQGTERNHLFLDFVLDQFVTKRLPKDPLVVSALRLGAYQLLRLSRIPPRAAVHATVSLLREAKGFANAVLRQVATHVVTKVADKNRPQRELPLPEGPDGARCLVFDADVLPPAQTAEYLAVCHGLPPFLVQRWVAAHGIERAAAVAVASGLAPAVVLRATAAANQDSLQVRLAAEGVRIEAIAGADGMFRVVDGRPFATPAFAAGAFVAQDATAYAAALAVDAKPGEVVLDLCAAPGTKTTVLAEAVGVAGRVFAFDPDPRRRARIHENLQRLGLTDRVTVIDDLDALTGPVDRVLCDAPCSNTGVLARRVEVRRRLSVTSFAELAATQRELLAEAVARCRDGGVVVYSTCSIEPEENGEVVAAVLGGGRGARCEWLDERLTLPGAGVGDGGYHAVLGVKRAL